jgi:hypothetical protein
MVINQIGPMSAAKVAGVLYALMGLIGGAFVSLAAMLGAFNSGDEGGALIGAIFGVGAIIFLPIFYGTLGFVMTLFMTWVYNLIASAVGGIEIDVR